MGASSLTTVELVDTSETPGSKEDSRKGFPEEVTFQLNWKGWVEVGPEN